jgi:hypothetical protein
MCCSPVLFLLKMTCVYKSSRESSPYKRPVGDESGQYEKHIQELKASLDEAHREKYKLIDEVRRILILYSRIDYASK